VRIDCTMNEIDRPWWQVWDPEAAELLARVQGYHWDDIGPRRYQPNQRERRARLGLMGRAGGSSHLVAFPSDHSVMVLDPELGAVVHTVPHDQPLSCLRVEEDRLLLGFANGGVQAWVVPASMTTLRPANKRG
jgi:hypothetical protein